MKKAISMVLAVAMMATMLVGCGKKSEEKKVVNADDPIVLMLPSTSEYEIIGYMTLLALEKGGYACENKIGAISGLDMLREMMLSDECDITMGYTGNGMYYMEEEGEKVWNSLQDGYARIKDYDKKTNNVDWLSPAPANNTELLAVTKEFAAANNIEDMYDFAEYVNNGGELKLATPQYWVEYAQGLPGMEKAYGFKVAENQLVIGAKAEKEVSEGTDGMNCTMIFTTDGRIDELGLYVIKDPLEIPPVYAPCLVAKGAVMEAYPEIADLTNAFMKTLTTEVLIGLNRKVDSEGADPETVARDYLVSIGLLDAE
ncbi:MAG: hypothetical protein CVU91_05575 [Firmicutes bacterium HGW-Firmicutes-16]|nr:MAG: hypothetical protein CVU91_05575 [Firmicutes bacterium HGW-Firmicutes-16]